MNVNAQEIVAVLLGNGLIWKLRFFATPGPSISLSNQNAALGNSEFPRLLEIENVGVKVAQNLEWEIREYYATVPPSYEARRVKRLAPLKPGERTVIDVGSESAEVAFLTHFEIIVSYSGLDGANFRSHFTVDGEVTRNDSGLNQARWTFARPLLRVWMQQFYNNLLIYTRVRIRPVAYSLLGR
jgi:hypothetical protein